MIHVGLQDGIATARLEHGKANALDLELLRELADVLRRVQASGARAVILTGTGGIFSAGVDLFRVVDGGDAYAREFVPLLSAVILQLFEYALPVVAAVNGHAVAGGCILACACDRRLMAGGKGTIGVPELRVGVPFPRAAIEIMRHAVAPHELQTLVYVGRTYPPSEALARGLVDEVVEPDALPARARQVAEQFAGIPPHVFAATKQTLRADAAARVRSDTTADEVLRHWANADTRAHIRDYLDRIMTRNR